MNIGFRFAWRNLWRHKRRTWLTTGAMVFSNVLLVFLVSWQFATYELMINNNLRMLTGHLQLQNPKFLEKPRIDNSFAINDERLLALGKHPDVRALSRRSEAFALASSAERSYGMQLIGVDPQNEKQVSNLPELISSGRYLQQNSVEPEIVIGLALARNLKIEVGDELTIFGSGRDGSTAAAILNVVGILKSGSNEIDRALSFVHIEQFDSIFSMQGQIHRLVILTSDVNKTEEISASLPQPENNTAYRDWNTLAPELKQAIQSDMVSSWFMYFILIILVSFSVLNTQLMSVLERTKEYGVMMALGLRVRRLAYLVFVETALMAAIGLIIGLSLGGILVIYLSYSGLTIPGAEEMAAQYNMPATVFPHLTFLSASMGPCLIFLASVIASIYPALRLNRLHIVQAMRAP